MLVNRSLVDLSSSLAYPYLFFLIILLIVAIVRLVHIRAAFHTVVAQSSESSGRRKET
jgi:hypothetical protein